MTFQIVIFIFGALLFLLGRVGRIILRDLAIGTDKPQIRWFAFIVGIGFMILSFVIDTQQTEEVQATGFLRMLTMLCSWPAGTRYCLK